MPLWLSFKRGNLKPNIQYPAALAGPAVAGLVAKGEMHKAGLTTGAPRFAFTSFLLHGETVFAIFRVLLTQRLVPQLRDPKCCLKIL